MTDKSGESFDRGDLDLITGMDLDPDMPEFLRGSDDELTADEMAALEADERGETIEEPNDGTTETQTETTSEAETGVLTEQGAEGGEGKSQTGDGAESTDDRGDGETDAGKAKMVDYGALHAEREKHKSTKRELGEWRDKFSRLEGRLDALQDLTKKPEKAEGEGDDAAAAADDDEMPDPAEDIFKFAEWQGRKIERLETAHKQTADTVAEGQRRSETASEQAEIVSSFQQDALAFSTQTPQFADAYAFLVASRNQELELMGYSDPKERVAQINKDELSIVRTAFEGKESPSEALYNLALARGFQPGKAEAADNAADTGAQTDSAGQTETTSQATQGADTATSKTQTGTKTIEDLKKASNAAMSLSNAGGADAAEITIEMLADMKQHEFEAFYAKHAAEVDRVMGA